MSRWLCVLAVLYLLVNASIAFADPVTLRTRIEASGPAVTMGDVFDGAGAAAGRAIAPAPAPGQIGSISMPVLYAAASAAGLEFTPPPGVTSVQVVRPGGIAATLPPAAGARSVSDAAIRRGENVTVVYQAAGVALSMRARALEDGAVGQNVRFLNTSSNRTVDATVTGPGAARVETP